MRVDKCRSIESKRSTPDLPLYYSGNSGNVSVYVSLTIDPKTIFYYFNIQVFLKIEIIKKNIYIPI